VIEVDSVQGERGRGVCNQAVPEDIAFEQAEEEIIILGQNRRQLNPFKVQTTVRRQAEKRREQLPELRVSQ
jgi:hypothetical protein